MPGIFFKYLGKGDQTMPGNFSGRYWGKINARHLPMVTAKALEVPRKMAATIRRIARKKMQHDVTNACWKRHLEHLRRDGWRVSRLQWETAKSRLHSGAAIVPLWSTLPAMRHEEDDVTFSAPACELRVKYDREHFEQIIKSHPLPRRWRPCHNDRLRLLCNASAFIAAIARLHSPAGSFLTFSQVP